MNDGEARRGTPRAAQCAVHGYATKFLPLGGHEHMFWVFESAQKMKLLAFILLFSSHCEGSLESVYRKRAVPFMHTIFFWASFDS